MLEELGQLERDGLGALAQAGDAAGLERWRIEYLGAKGRLRALMPRLKEVSKEDKPAIGKRLNDVKAALEAAFQTKTQSIAAGRKDSGPIVDVTEPGLELRSGRRHVLSRTIDEITDVFARMGFSIAEGPEVEDEWHNFAALNIPPEHPARDPMDNFYLRRAERDPPHAAMRTSEPSPSGRGQGEGKRATTATTQSPSPPTPFPGGEGSRMFRSQTSTIQIRTMEKTKPPLRVVAIGRVYRPDTHDATHFSMFHQIEGLYVDRNVTMVDLKTTLFQFARAYFGEQAEVRMRPSFFPFTEPSAEVDMKMKVRGEWQWVELGGCGMVDPNVFRAVGYDPEEWTGFAFGLGVERIAMRKYGITDIRMLFENDVRFLRQF